MNRQAFSQIGAKLERLPKLQNICSVFNLLILKSTFSNYSCHLSSLLWTSSQTSLMFDTKYLLTLTKFILQKKRKELEESNINDNLLLVKSSLDINLLPETDEDRNLASLLSLKPSRSIEESQNQTRNIILNSPALPSSSGLVTTFGGLKKEETLKKAFSLTRNSLGITIKNKDGSGGKECPENIKSDKEEIKNNEEHNQIKTIQKEKVESDIKDQDNNNERVKIVKNTEHINNDHKSLSLVGDYSSSGDNSD